MTAQLEMPTSLPLPGRTPLYALSLWQPWAWSLFHGKRVENRRWHPPAWLRGQLVAIHAAKRYEVGDWDALLGLLRNVPPAASITRGAIIGIARFVQSYDKGKPSPLYDDPFFAGPVGWYFVEPVEFNEAVPCRGFQKLWQVTGATLEAVRQAYRLAPKGGTA